MDEKEQLDQTIKIVKVRIDSLIPRINKFDGMKIFYSILDAVDSELNEVFRAIELEGKKDDDNMKFSYSNANEHFFILFKLMNYFITTFKNNKSLMSNIPVIVNLLYRYLLVILSQCKMKNLRQ